MIRFEISTEIKRPLGEVFAYVDDPSNLAKWNSIVEESRASEMPVRRGTRITTRARFLGRHVDSISEVTEHVPNQKFVQKSDKPYIATKQFQAKFRALAARAHANYLTSAGACASSSSFIVSSCVDNTCGHGRACVSEGDGWVNWSGLATLGASLEAANMAGAERLLTASRRDSIM